MIKQYSLYSLKWCIILVSGLRFSNKSIILVSYHFSGWILSRVPKSIILVGELLLPPEKSTDPNNAHTILTCRETKQCAPVRASEMSNFGIPPLLRGPEIPNAFHLARLQSRDEAMRSRKSLEEVRISEYPIAPGIPASSGGNHCTKNNSAQT